MKIKNNLTNEKLSDPFSAKKIAWVVLSILLTIVLNINLASGALSNDLQAYFTLDESSGVYADSATGKNNATVFGNWDRGIPGRLGNAADNNGDAGSILNLTNSASINFSSTMSVSFWINTSVSQTAPTIMRQQGSGTDTRFIWFANETTSRGSFQFRIFETDGTSINVQEMNGNNFILGEWTFVTGVANGTFLILYVNGVEINKTAYDGTIRNADVPIIIGQFVGGTAYNGTIDEIGFWNRTLTPTEITALYNSGSGLSPLDTSTGRVSVNLNIPTNADTFVGTSKLFNATVLPTNVNLTNSTFMIWYTNGTLFNETIRTMNLTRNETTFTLFNIPLGNFKWNVLGCGINSSNSVKCSVATSNFTFDRNAFAIETEFFPLTAFETESHIFELNITTISSILSITSNLIYNGTSFAATSSCNASGFCNIQRTIDIPLVQQQSQNKTFFWQINVFDGSVTLAANTSSQSHNISIINLQECGGSITDVALNFTTRDEADNSRIIPFYFAANFEFWLGDGTITKTNSFSNTANNENTVCISPISRNFTVDATIEYNDVINSTTYNTRNYFFQQQRVTNVNQNISLFLLKSDDSTSFILKVQDTNLLPVANALIQIERFNPGTGNFTIVSIAKTDDNGQTVGFFKTETVDYKFTIIKNGIVLLATSQQKVVPESSPFTLTFTVGADEGAPWVRFEDLGNLEKSLIYNKTSANVIFAYVDTSNQFTLGRLIVLRNNLASGSTTICDINSTLTSATLTCDVGNSTGTYTASVFITRGTDIFLVDQIIFKIETFSDTMGLLGVFIAWMIILVSAFAFKFNEIAGIVLINITVIFVNLIGLVNFGYLYVFGMMGVSIMIIIQLKR